MRQSTPLSLAVLLLALLVSVARAEPRRPVPGVQRVLIISVDGMRPDLMLRADTPNLHALFHSGAYSFWARTTDIAITLPSHVSMLTGVKPPQHRIQFNDDRATTRPLFPNAETIFELAKQQGYSTALVAGKWKFIALSRPGSVDYYAATDSKTEESGGSTVVGEATRLIRKHRPQVMFVHFPYPDGAGHAKGWGSPEQIAAIEKSDRAIGQILQTLTETGLKDSTLILVSADHGGSGRQHGKGDERSRFIPWIVSGPGVRQDYDLTQMKEVLINTEDTFATACWVMGIPLPEGIPGKPILSIFDGIDLMQEIPTKPNRYPTTAPTAESR